MSWKAARSRTRVHGAVVAAEGASCGLIEDGVEYHTQQRLPVITETIASAELCCTECEARPDCGAWTWGKQPNVVGLTDTCFLMELQDGEEVEKVPRPEVVSGLSARNVRKHGFMAEMRAKQLRASQLLREKRSHGVLPNETCAGNLSVMAGGNFSLVTVPGEQAGKVEVFADAWVVPHIGGKAYFAESCAGDGPQEVYASFELLGKTLRYTTDLSGAGCGCKATLSLVSMNSKLSEFEVDIQEGNQYAWASRFHAFDDPQGVSMGYGGGGTDGKGDRDWKEEDYGPEGRCINTSLPFDVAASFLTKEGDEDQLEALEVELSQYNSPCSLAARLDKYSFRQAKWSGVAKLSAELRAGMTPSVSYVGSRDNLMFDGPGLDGKGPCVQDVPEVCPETVRFYDFSVAPVDEPNPRVVQRRNFSNPMFGAPSSALVHNIVYQGFRLLWRTDRRGQYVSKNMSLGKNPGTRGVERD